MSRIQFSSDEILERFREIFIFCNEEGIQLLSDEIEEVDSSDYNFEQFLELDYDEDVVIDDDTIIKLYLPYSDEGYNTGINDFYEMMQQTSKGKIEDEMQFFSPKFSLFYVEGELSPQVRFPVDKISIVEQKWNDTEIIVELVQGFTCYGLRLTMDNLYDKYYWPMAMEDTFIQIKANDNLSSQDFKEIAEAYVFELQSSYSLDIQLSVRPTSILSEYDDFDDETSHDHMKELRPLLNGKGINALLKIYNSCSKIEDNEFRILNYTKVIEYVSQSVVRKEMIESIQRKLGSSRALQPDATYILELESLYDEHRNNKNKDSQAISLTVGICCDITDLLESAPDFLKKFKEFKSRGDVGDLRSKCLDELAGSISDTRNMIAHAKTNYKLKGKECPSDQLEEFATCLKIVATQVIRWFARLGEESRVV